MNNREHQTPGDREHAELLGLDGMISSLGKSERAGALPGFEERVFAASRVSLVPMAADVAVTAVRVDRLAAEDAGAGRAALESQAFELSREAVTSGRVMFEGEKSTPPLRLASEVAPTARVVVRSRQLGWALRIAAAIALVGAGVIALRQTLVTPTPATDTTLASNSSEQLAENFDSEMAALFELVGSDTGDGGTGTVESEHDTAWMDDLFTKESL
jgi:hypothetical protein